METLIRRFREIIAKTLQDEPNIDLEKVMKVMRLIEKLAPDKEKDLRAA